MDDKQKYEQALALVHAKRCATCEYCQPKSAGLPSICKQFDDEPIPEGYMYTPNECALYMIDIPF